MTRAVRIACVLLTAACIAPVWAQTADEAVAIVKKAREYLKSQGIEKACKDFADPAGGFRKGDFAVDVADMREAGHLKMVCHGTNPRLNGKELFELKDVDGKYFNKERVETLKAKGKGWVDYHWLNPVSGNIEAKSSYSEVQDGFVISAGIYKK